MRCIVIEDDLVQQQLICNYINETATLNLIACYTKYIDAIKELKTKTVLVFMSQIS
jgi:hypothetical protein